MLMQREDILDWFFVPHKPSKKIRNVCGKGLWVNSKGKLRLHQVAGIDSVEIVVPFNKGEIDKLWAENYPVQELAVIFGRD